MTQMLRQTDAKVFKKYSQMKLQMKREALTRLNRQAGDAGSSVSVRAIQGQLRAADQRAGVSWATSAIFRRSIPGKTASR